jgi:hypothetical protein
MKVPMRYQNTEYDCGTTSFVNAIAYLFDREDVPVELLKAIYRYTLDVETEGIIGKGGTSRTHAEMLAKYFVKFANETKGFNLKCKILSKDQVNLDDMKKCLDNNGVIVARCWMEVEHYVIITKIDDNFAYLFDPYYLDEDYYYGDDEVAIALHQTFTHNRVVKLTRLMSEEYKDFSLLPVNDREVILINK